MNKEKTFNKYLANCTSIRTVTVHDEFSDESYLNIEKTFFENIFTFKNWENDYPIFTNEETGNDHYIFLTDNNYADIW